MSLKEMDRQFSALDRQLANMREKGLDRRETACYFKLLQEQSWINRKRILASGIRLQVMRATGE